MRRSPRPRGRDVGGERSAAPREVHPLRIDSLAAGGEGVGRLADGRVAFVHRTAPGDLVEVRPIHQQKRWIRARLLRVLEPSPDRREAPCPHYRECGGCTLEHLPYEVQLHAKGRIVADALQRLAGVQASEVPVVASPREFRYRNRVSFALRRLGAGRVVAGFHALHDAERIVDLDGRCLLPEEPIARVWERLRAAWGPDANRLPSGERLRLTLRSTAEGRVSLLVEGGFARGRPDELLAHVQGLDSIWHRPGSSAAELLAGEPVLFDRWDDEVVELRGAAFLQVNREAARLLDEHLYSEVGDARGLRVIDAYAGVGLHARRLARAGATVCGIELDADAVAAARSAGLAGVEFLQGDVAELLPTRLPADLVILNPPRAGVAPEVADALLASPPGRVAYVSCNPATLARDIRRLDTGFELVRAHAFDLFPQTAHVETVALLHRRG